MLVLEICRFKGRKIIIRNTTTVCSLVNILQDMSLQMEEYIESILCKWDELASAVLELVFWNQPYIVSSFYLCKSKSIYHICSALCTYLAFIYLPGWDDLQRLRSLAWDHYRASNKSPIPQLLPPTVIRAPTSPSHRSHDWALSIFVIFANLVSGKEIKFLLLFLIW